MWINRLLHVGNKTYIFDKNIFGLKYVVWTVQSFKWSLHLLNKCFVFWTFRMISCKLSKIARIKIFLKINGLQIDTIRILSRITAKIKFMFELPLILTEMIIN